MSTRSSKPCWRRATIAACLTVTASLLGCSPAGPGLTASTAAGPTVTGAWVRPPQGPERPAAGYLVITGGGSADALLGATSPAAGRVEVHESATDSSGMSGMHPIHRLEIPAGATVELRSGGYHLMLMDVAPGSIEAGRSVELRLTFEKAGVVVVRAEVRTG